jgi:voltage-gated potassium channel
MALFLARLWRRCTRQQSWLLPLAVAGFVFVTGWLMMTLAQPGTDIAQPRNYWWWFLITAATVGYGDLFPETFGGRLVGAYVVVGGIVTITMIFARVAGTIENARGRRMQGQAGFEGSGQVVVVGFTAGRTERLVSALLGDGDRQVVVCAWEDQAAEHPMTREERVHFVRGDLTDEAVLRRAGLDRAASVLVDARDDNEAVTLTVAADHVAPGVHTVVALRDLGLRRTIARIDATVHCVQWHSTGLITEELQDAGIALVYQELMTPGGNGTYSTAVPGDARTASYGEWQQALGRTLGTTLLAVADGDGVRVSPAWETPVGTGATLFYVAPERLTAEQLVRALG